jgi:predicted membrane protein
MHGTVNDIIFGSLAILALLLGVALILVSSIFLKWGRKKEIYPAQLAQRLGTWITGTALAVLAILFIF